MIKDMSEHQDGEIQSRKLRVEEIELIRERQISFRPYQEHRREYERSGGCRLRGP